MLLQLEVNEMCVSSRTKKNKFDFMECGLR